MISGLALRGLLLACLMKMCQKVVESQFFLMDPSLFRLKADNSTPAEGDTTCRFEGSSHSDRPQSSTTLWIFTARYLLPVLGGLLASAWLGYVRVLQIGGVIMLLATVLMSRSVYLGLMCESSAIIPITWLLLPLFFGLTQPNIMHGIFHCHSQPKLHTLASAAYYSSSVIGEWIALLLPSLSDDSKLGSHATLIFIAFGCMFLMLSSFLSNDLNREPFEMPTRSRMIRYCQIFSGLILFLFCVADTRPAMYTAEMDYFLKGTNSSSFTESAWLSANWLNLLTMLPICLLLTCITLLRSHELPVQPRMQLGILLEAAVATCLMILTAIGTPNPTAVVAVYSAASVVDAVAEVLIMVAAYDLVQQMAPSNSKIFVYGIMFTVWGLADFASRGAIIITEDLRRLGQSDKPNFYIYHLISLVVLIACSVYHRFLALPLALHLTPADSDDPDIASELRPLLYTAAD